MIHLIEGSFGIVKEPIFIGRGVLYLQITFYEEKGRKRNVGNVVRNALDYYNGRVETTSLSYVGPYVNMVLPDMDAVTIKFPIKIYTQHEMRCKRYVESFLYTFVNDYKK